MKTMPLRRFEIPGWGGNKEKSPFPEEARRVENSEGKPPFSLGTSKQLPLSKLEEKTVNPPSEEVMAALGNFPQKKGL